MEHVSTKCVNPLSANPTKWSNTLRQYRGNNRRIVLSVFGHFVGLSCGFNASYGMDESISSFLVPLEEL